MFLSRLPIAPSLRRIHSISRSRESHMTKDESPIYSSMDNHYPDDSNRPKKLIFAPGDIITPEPSTTTTRPIHLDQHPETPSLPPSTTSTPTSASESHLLTHPARAHQFLSNPPLTISHIHPSNPLRFFNTWFHDPRLPPSSAPETCTLATASLPSGRVSARIVYLKELDERGFVVYSNWGSREGKGGQVFGTGDGLGEIPHPGEDTGGNRWAALTFSWTMVERQVRVEGLMEPLSREESEIYWRTRERGSQIGAWASWQSRVLWSSESGEGQDGGDGRDALEKRVNDVQKQFEGVERIPLPPFWGGVRLVPESVEFWQGRRSRLHDRFRYVRVGEGWRIERLSP